MHNESEPEFGTLDRAESEAILSRNHVGRIAYTFHDRADIEPIHYVHDGGWIYGRTSPGAKLATLAHHRWAAFEVDEVEGPFDWRSVVVHGTVYLLTTSSDSNASERDVSRAVTLLRRVAPDILTADDPASFRTVLFRLSTSEITGRFARGGRSVSRRGNAATGGDVPSVER